MTYTPLDRALIILAILIAVFGVLLPWVLFALQNSGKIKTAAEWHVYTAGMKIIKKCEKIQQNMDKFYLDDEEECPDWADPKLFEETRL